MAKKKRYGLSVFSNFKVPHANDSSYTSIYPLYREDGFLSSEQNYNNLKKILETQSVNYFLNSMNSDLVSKIVSHYDEHKHVIYLSNAFTRGWMGDDFKGMKKLLIYLQLRNDYHLDVYTRKNN